jgi:hypothetical protein
LAARAAISPALVEEVASATGPAVREAVWVTVAVQGMAASATEAGLAVAATASAAATFPAAAAATVAPSVEETAISVDQMLALPAAADRPACPGAAAVVGAAEAAGAVVAAAADAGKNRISIRSGRGTDMRHIESHGNGFAAIVLLAAIACAGLSAASAQQAAAPKPAPATAPAGTKTATAAGAGAASGQTTFASPEQAADTLIAAADKFDQASLLGIFGPDGKDIVFSGEIGQDRKHAEDFVAKAREKKDVSVDPKNASRALLVVGSDDWPFPVPIVKSGAKWYFDSKAGRQELLYRRIGDNELDAIGVCHGYVEAQYDYAFRKRQGYEVSQFAQRIISTPGTQDGLAWQNADGAWEGPIGEKIAKAVGEGFDLASPYHGYYFKILTGQGPDAPLGRLDYVIKGVMIGGFALVASPAEYSVTGVRSFIVSQDGVVYEKDLGPSSLDQFKAMELFNPDKSWDPVQDDDDND